MNKYMKKDNVPEMILSDCEDFEIDDLIEIPEIIETFNKERT